jgi:hypothetical protein
MSQRMCKHQVLINPYSRFYTMSCNSLQLNEFFSLIIPPKYLMSVPTVYTKNIYIFISIMTRLLAVGCYLSCINAIKNSQTRSDLEMPVEVAFFHGWELH